MKLTDLAIGDLILINNTPHKIQAIDSIDAEIQADDELYYVGEDRHHSEDKIEGIPITLEILEKNGFVQDDEYTDAIADGCFCRFLIWHYYANEVIISYDGSEELVISNNLGYPCSEITLYRPKIHELQHALRLCGLNELANNFKV